MREVFLNIAPNNVPTPITEGMHNNVTRVMWGDINTNDSEQPIICVAALKPPETVCLKLLLKSCTSVVNLQDLKV